MESVHPDEPPDELAIDINSTKFSGGLVIALGQSGGRAAEQRNENKEKVGECQAQRIMCTAKHSQDDGVHHLAFQEAKK
eukprot:1334830-Rhodomonas_salina.2